MGRQIKLVEVYALVYLDLNVELGDVDYTSFRLPLFIHSTNMS